MQDIPEDWEVVLRKIQRHWLATIIFNGLFFWLPIDAPQIMSSITWTVRQKATGIVRRVTTVYKADAVAVAAKGYFDAE
ncbi:MAG TPA: hypothetical protein VKW08_24045 [Xanthobacteraceae bacterium]|jgi:hypothetical protein|nr:hypothetical protein [Xanthobacteraceae bacterium]